MTKTLRPGKVFIDWSQNNPAKTTVTVYSLRARPRPTVSTPISWDEVADCTKPEQLVFEAAGRAGAGRGERGSVRATCSAEADVTSHRWVLTRACHTTQTADRRQPSCSDSVLARELATLARHPPRDLSRGDRRCAGRAHQAHAAARGRVPAAFSGSRRAAPAAYPLRQPGGGRAGLTIPASIPAAQSDAQSLARMHECDCLASRARPLRRGGPRGAPQVKPGGEPR